MQELAEAVVSKLGGAVMLKFGGTVVSKRGERIDRVLFGRIGRPINRPPKGVYIYSYT